MDSPVRVSLFCFCCKKAEREKKITSGLFLSAKEIVSLFLFCLFLLLNLARRSKKKEEEEMKTEQRADNKNTGNDCFTPFVTAETQQQQL